MYPTLLVVAISIERLLGSEIVRTVHSLTQNAPPSGPPPVRPVQAYEHTVMFDDAANSSIPTAIELRSIPSICEPEVKRGLV